jgi:hypothetical protein
VGVWRGRQTRKRGFENATSARVAHRRTVEQIERGETLYANETFGSWWETWIRRQRPYLEPNAWRAYDVDGRKRLLPAFANTRLDRLGGNQIRGWMDEQAEAVEAQEVAPLASTPTRVTRL